MNQVDLEFKETLVDYEFGNALVVDLEFKEAMPTMNSEILLW